VPEPHAFAVRNNAVRLRAADRSRENPPCHRVSRPTLPRPPHPRPNVVTLANAPSEQDGMGKDIILIWRNGQDEHFLKIRKYELT